MRISRALLARIRRETACRHPLEACGLLIGREGLIEGAVASPNRSADPARAFVIDPALHISVQRCAREAGRRVLGHYHSHPGGRAEPSAVDVERAAEEGVLWLILAKSEAALWIARKGGALGGRFDAVPLTVFNPLPCNRAGEQPIGNQ